MLLHIIIASCMSLTIPLLSYLNRKANQNSYTNFDELKIPKIYLYMGYLLILISLGILILPKFIKNPPEHYHPVIWILILSIFLLGIYIIRLYSIHQVKIKENEFMIYSTFGGKKTFQVDKIKSLNINYLTYFITIRDKDGNIGKVYFHLVGLILLLRKIKTHSRSDTSKIERLLKI